jgi:hypothetical protein
MRVNDLKPHTVYIGINRWYALDLADVGSATLVTDTRHSWPDALSPARALAGLVAGGEYLFGSCGIPWCGD